MRSPWRPLQGSASGGIGDAGGYEFLSRQRTWGLSVTRASVTTNEILCWPDKVPFASEYGSGRKKKYYYEYRGFNSPNRRNPRGTLGSGLPASMMELRRRAIPL